MTLSLAMMLKVIKLTELILKNFYEQPYKTTFTISKNKFINRLMELLFLCFHEQIWFNEYLGEFKPVYYRRYVDNITALFHSPDNLEK